MNRGETAAHQQLKRMAFVWAQQNGFPIAACEVRIPSSGYRADVAGCSLSRKDAPRAVALFECKQCRADFLRDEADETTTRTQATALNERMNALRALIAVHRPDLRLGVSLFPEYDDYDFRGLKHSGLHAVETELETLQRKLLQCVKFSRLKRYHAADHLYLVTEAGILSENEVPLGWGWLVREGETLVCRTKPLRLSPTPQQIERWLEAIAAAGARATAKLIGINHAPPPESALDTRVPSSP
ncbi:MAG: hypothetical protein QM790_13415 [Nibricoccus sp.]